MDKNNIALLFYCTHILFENMRFPAYYSYFPFCFHLCRIPTIPLFGDFPHAHFLRSPDPFKVGRPEGPMSFEMDSTFILFSVRNFFHRGGAGKEKNNTGCMRISRSDENKDNEDT